jgi:hypothetical protein
MLGAEDALGSGQISVFMCDTRDDPDRERRYLEGLLSRLISSGWPARRPSSTPAPNADPQHAQDQTGEPSGCLGPPRPGALLSDQDRQYGIQIKTGKGHGCKPNSSVSLGRDLA